MAYTFPDFAKFGTCFTLEGPPGTNTQSRKFIFTNTSYSNSKCELQNKITENDINLDIPESYRNIYKKLNSLLHKNTLHATNNGELMQIRLLKYIQMSNVTSEDGDYYPNEMEAFFTRGFNGTTPVSQYGYSAESGGYFSNVFCYANDNVETNINASLSGAIFSALTTNSTEIDFYFTNDFGASTGTSGLIDYIYDYDHLKLRFNMGDNPLTLEDVIVLQNNPNNVTVINKINQRFSGKVLKVYSAEGDVYEDMLIIDVKEVYQNSEYRLCPNDTGYMPDGIIFNVVRGYNNTTIIQGSDNAQGISFSKPGGQFYNNLVVNAYIEGSNTIDDAVSDTLSLTNQLNNTGEFLQIVSDHIGVSVNNLDYGSVSVYVYDIIIFTEALQNFTTREFLFMLNDLFILKDKEKDNVNYINMINDLIRVFDESNLLDFLDYFASVRDFLQIKTTSTALDVINQIFDVVLGDFIRTLENTTSFADYSDRVIDFLRLRTDSTLSGNILVQLSDTFKFTDSMHNNIDIKVIIEEILKSTFVVEIEGEQYECYALNLDNKALTRYTNYNFNSYAHFNNKYYAFGKDGLYDLISLDEEGKEELVSKVKTSFLNITDNGYNILGGLGSLQKSIKNGYFVIKNDGQVGLRIYTDLGNSFDYILKQDYNDNKFRTNFGSNVRGSIFQLELTVFDDFEFEQCELVPIVHSKKV